MDNLRDHGLLPDLRGVSLGQSEAALPMVLTPSRPQMYTGFKNTLYSQKQNDPLSQFFNIFMKERIE
jgi:hypothetical protein